jgi:hypothetical protein
MAPEGSAVPTPKPRRVDTLIKALVRSHRWRRRIFVSIDSLREARLVLKTISALTGLISPKLQGLQWYLPDQGLVEWTGADGETIHDLSEPTRFRPPVRTRHACH